MWSGSGIIDGTIGGGGGAPAAGCGSCGCGVTPGRETGGPPLDAEIGPDLDLAPRAVNGGVRTKVADLTGCGSGDACPKADVDDARRAGSAPRASETRAWWGGSPFQNAPERSALPQTAKCKSCRAAWKAAYGKAKNNCLTQCDDLVNSGSIQSKCHHCCEVSCHAQATQAAIWDVRNFSGDTCETSCCFGPPYFAGFHGCDQYGSCTDQGAILSWNLWCA